MRRDRFGRLQRRSRRLQLLQPRNPINAHRIRHFGPVPQTFALGNTVSETSQHVIQPTGQRITHQICSRFRTQRNHHASDFTDRH